MKKFLITLTIALIVASSTFAQTAKEVKGSTLSDDQIVEIATQAYVYGYPLILMDHTKRIITNVAVPNNYGSAPVNQISHYRSFPDHTNTEVVKMNVDTYYSFVWFDLSAEPMVLSVPATERYYLLPLLDAYSNVFASPGPRTTGTKAQDFLLADPNYQGDTSKGMTLIQSQTSTVWMIGRTKVLNNQDGATVVRKIQDGIKVVPLSSFGKKYNPPKGVISKKAKTIIPAQDTENLPIEKFFNMMTELMVENPAAPADVEIVKSMASIGIVPGKKFDFKTLNKELQEKLKAIPAEVHKNFEKARSTGDPRILINGWQVYTDGIGTYGTNYEVRAYVAYVGLGANLPQDAVYPVISNDQNGDQLMSENNYTIHFEKEEIPPVNAFWSLTLYNKNDFLAESAINRYSLGDRDELIYNEDGSLDIYIQQSSPGIKKEANWLPTPKEGKFNLTLRLYWPKESVLNRSWNVPAVVKTEGKKVTVLNFVRAETDMTMDRYVKMGVFGKFLHIRQPTPLDKQDIIRMNRDTLYSFGVFDLTEPLTITKPDSGNRMMSLSTSSQDHSISQAIYDEGDFTFTKESIGSRYVFVGFRTAVNPSDPEDIKKVNALQEQIKVKQANIGTFEIPNWDLESLSEVRDAVNVLASTMEDTTGFFGDKSKLDPIQHLMGTAFGWGGNPKENAIYLNVFPEENDGKVAYVLNVKDVPVDAFWSITVYNAKGFMEPNKRNAVSVNSSAATPNADGSFTIHFGGPEDAVNQLPIMPGWNYIVRLYRPRKELLDGSWKFPSPKEVK